MAIYKLTRKTFSTEYIQAAGEKAAGTLKVPLAKRVAELKAQMQPLLHRRRWIGQLEKELVMHFKNK